MRIKMVAPNKVAPNAIVQKNSSVSLQPNQTGLAQDKRVEQCLCDGHCPRCLPLQPKRKNENPGNVPVTTADLNVLKQGGNPLPKSEQQFFESRFGHDFSGVRIHSGAQANQLAEQYNAKALTSGKNIVFNARAYSPGTKAGQRLLAHELTHVLQQRSGKNTPELQCKYQLEKDLYDFVQDQPRLASSKIGSSPDTFYYPSKYKKNTKKTAFVVAGIHGNEKSAWKLGKRAQSNLQAGTPKPDFHTIIIPRANPTTQRSAGKGLAYESDLNRAFGTGYTSPNPYAATITNVVKEFDPEQVLSIHSISSSQKVGIYLDPIHARKKMTPAAIKALLPKNKDIKKLYKLLKNKLRAKKMNPNLIWDLMIDRLSYPDITTPFFKEIAYIFKDENKAAMELTEKMITAVNPAATTTLTPGNKPSKAFPTPLYPDISKSAAYNLLYPQQQQVQKKSISLGEWLSGHGKTVVTMELPQWQGSKTWAKILPFLKAIWRFLKF
ncbi:DUF4157 domain-containing protein [bacterium]|nr:DUF4157 domain-containing protein [bacterium]